MVLARLLLGLALSVFLVPSAVADSTSVQSFMFLKPECSIRKHAGTSWLAAPNVLSEGQVVLGKASQSGTDLIFVMSADNRQIYTGALDCFEKTDALEEKSVSQTRSVYRLSFSALTWHESFTLRDAANGDHPLLSNAVGICPGFISDRSWGNRMSWGYEACAFYAKAHVYDARSAEPLPLTYDVRNVNVFGLIAGAHWNWRPLSDNVALGLSVPLVIRHGQYPDTGLAGYSLSPGNTVIFPSLFFEARVERLPVIVSQKFGFFRGLSDFMWIFQLEYQL